MADVWIERGFAVANEKFCVSDMRSEPLARVFIDGCRAGDGLGAFAQGFLDGSELAAALLREQGVNFVKNHGLDGLAVDLAAVEKLENAARCADEDLWVLFQLFELVVDIGAAADEGEAIGRVERGVQIAHDVADLHGELLRWRDDEQLVAAFTRREFCQERQKIGQGFAATGARLQDEVAPFADEREGCRLHRHRLGDIERFFKRCGERLWKFIENGWHNVLLFQNVITSRSSGTSTGPLKCWRASAS